MRSSNPAFSRDEAFSRNNGYATFDVATPSSDQLEAQYGMPSPVRERTMTLDDVVARTATVFGLLLLTAAATFFVLQPGFIVIIGAALVGFVLAMVISFSKTPKPGLILGYAAIEGVFVGGISFVYANAFGQGIVPQAILGTLIAFSAMLIAYKSGLIRATGRFKKILIIATLGYALVGLVNLGLVIFGGSSLYFDTGILGIGLSLIGVTLASLFLVLDFDFIERGIANGLPAQYAWTAAFGLTVTLVWLYLEILRLLAILRGGE